ncbi:MAG TPA: hypothetical protein VGL68_05980 [Solirubrobacteraceae bacterium]|jgi:hypothetical protein
MADELLFWPLARGLLGERQNNPDEIRRLRSLLTYQILFGAKIVIRDSDYLNSVVLRSALVSTLDGRPDDNAAFFRALVDKGFLRLATRQEQSLGQVAEQLGRVGGSDLVLPDWYRSSTADIRYLEALHEQTDFVVPFSVRAAATYYTSEIQRMLSAPLEPYLDDSIRRRAAERVEEQITEQETLAWSFFAKNGDFWKGFSEADRGRYADFFYYVLGQAPHAGFIPDTVGIRPIYMQDAAEAIAIWRGRHLRTSELVDEQTISLGEGFSFSDYIEYLCLLPFERLARLLESEARAEFRLTCSQFTLHKARFNDVKAAYANYRRVIDSELLNCRRTLSASGSKTELRAFFGTAEGDAVDFGVDILAHELIGSTVPFWHLGLALFYRVARGEWPIQRERRVEREATQADIAGKIQLLQTKGSAVTAEVMLGGKDADVQEIKLETSMVEDICVAGTPRAPPNPSGASGSAG